jgi:hypothetical protein
MKMTQATGKHGWTLYHAPYFSNAIVRKYGGSQILCLISCSDYEQDEESDPPQSRKRKAPKASGDESTASAKKMKKRHKRFVTVVM